MMSLTCTTGNVEKFRWSDRSRHCSAVESTLCDLLDNFTIIVTSLLNEINFACPLNLCETFRAIRLFDFCNIWNCPNCSLLRTYELYLVKMIIFNLLKCGLQIIYSLNAHWFGWEYHLLFFWQPGVKGCPEPPGIEPLIIRFPAYCHGNLP